MDLVIFLNLSLVEAKVIQYLLNEVGLGEIKTPIRTLSYLNS